MELYFQKFAQSRITSRGIHKFSKSFLSIQLCSRNFQDSQLNGSHLRNSTVPELSGNFRGKFPYHSPPFPNFRKFWSNGKHPTIPIKTEGLSVTILCQSSCQTPVQTFVTRRLFCLRRFKKLRLWTASLVERTRLAVHKQRFLHLLRQNGQRVTKGYCF